jgi:hypothetical protein
LINPNVRVNVWASQLAANDFPPVCVYSGAPAETWWKFRAHTPYRWAIPLLFLLILMGIGLVLSPLIAYVLGRRASGYLPMKTIYARRLSTVTWVSGGLIGLGALIGLVTLIALSSGNLTLEIFVPLLALTSVIVLLIGWTGVQIGLQIGWNPFAPRGRVHERRPGDPDRIVEIYNVHPAFVEAVLKRQQAGLSR